MPTCGTTALVPLAWVPASPVVSAPLPPVLPLFSLPNTYSRWAHYVTEVDLAALPPFYDYVDVMHGLCGDEAGAATVGGVRPAAIEEQRSCRGVDQCHAAFGFGGGADGGLREDCACAYGSRRTLGGVSSGDGT